MDDGVRAKNLVKAAWMPALNLSGFEPRRGAGLDFGNRAHFPKPGLRLSLIL